MSKFALNILEKKVSPFTATRDPDVILGAATALGTLSGRIDRDITGGSLSLECGDRDKRVLYACSLCSQAVCSIVQI